MKSLVMAAGLAGLMQAGWAQAAFTLTSPDIKPGGTMAAKFVFNGFGCTGANVSPALSWSGAPQGTKSFALTVYDPDAPTGSGFWHWVLLDIPADVTALKQGGPLPDGVMQIHNDYGIAGYGGPCPPKGDEPHHYIFTLYAVDLSKLGVEPGVTAAVAGFNLHYHTLAKASFTARYGR